MYNLGLLNITWSLGTPKLPLKSLLLWALLVIQAVPPVSHHGGLVVAVDTLGEHPPPINDIVVVVQEQARNADMAAATPDTPLTFYCS